MAVQFTVPPGDGRWEPICISCKETATRYVEIDGLWDGSACCENERCVASVVAGFDHEQAAPRSTT